MLIDSGIHERTEDRRGQGTPSDSDKDLCKVCPAENKAPTGGTPLRIETARLFGSHITQLCPCVGPLGEAVTDQQTPRGGSLTTFLPINSQSFLEGEAKKYISGLTTDGILFYFKQTSNQIQSSGKKGKLQD